MLDREKYVWEYWHSFKGTSLENDLQFKDAIFSAFIHGYVKGVREDDKKRDDQISALQATITLNEATIDRLRKNRDDAMAEAARLQKQIDDDYWPLA